LTRGERAAGKRELAVGISAIKAQGISPSEFERKLAPRTELPSTLMTWGNYHVISKEEQVENAVQGLKEDCSVSGAIGIAHISSASGENLAGLAVSAAPGVVYFFDTCSLNQCLPPALVVLLRDEGIEKRGWGLKEVWKQLYVSCAVPLQGCLFDIRIASDLVHAGRNISNQSIVRRYLGEDWISDEPSQGAREIPFWTPHNARAALRCCEMAYLLPDRIKVDLESTGAFRVAYEIEFRLISVLARMELAGVPFSRERLWDIHRRAEMEMRAVEIEALTLIPDSGQNFNLASRDEVSRLLFDTWKLPISLKTGNGKPSTGRLTLAKIVENRDVVESQRKFVKLLLKFRELRKIENTYTRSLVNAVTENGRIHATIVQDASVTGRLSMSNPNLQSIPVRSDLGREVRGAIVAREGFSIMCADYSQIELRILAALSGDEKMISAFLNRIDIHTFVAARIFDVSDMRKVSSEQRSRAKAVSYGIPYGISAFGLSQQLGVSLAEAKFLITDFHREFPRIEQFTGTLISAARSKGYAETLCGRRLYLPLLRHGATTERRAAERVAVNMPIQGTQADMIKRAMIGINDRLQVMNVSSRMILQVHDELVFEVADREQSTVEELTIEMMSHALPLPHGVSVEVKLGTGRTWQEAASRSTILQ
jgi:DNA polymerase I